MIGPIWTTPTWTIPTWTTWRNCLPLGAATALTAIAALTTLSPSAQARFWVGVGGPCCGYWAPGPSYGYPPPYAYAPPPGYYPPPEGYAQPAAPSAYAPDGAPSAYAPEPMNTPASAVAAPAQNSPAITYTNKPAFKNAAGQTCRQYKTTDTTNAHPVDVFGTACQDTDGQWRVAN